VGDRDAALLDHRSRERADTAETGDGGGRFVTSEPVENAARAAMTDTGLPHLPGVATVSEILTALEAGYTELKFFPAEAAGGRTT
jgi:2-dehydro-3-deoxyphosphogluconate aldolase / (4S)-4-hydroxy-2-oxoglutarate aldolase